MKKSKTGISAYDAALDYLTPKARTVREVELRLDEGNYSEAEIMQTVERLQENGLLDDAKYARDFIESRLNTKPVSKRKLCEQLTRHFVPEDIIVGALEKVKDGIESENAKLVAEKYFRQFASLELSERLRRVRMRLVSRGYNYDTVKSVLSALTDEMKTADDAYDGDDE